MKPIQITALAVLAVFYIAYFTKMILQRRKGIKTDQIGKGNKPKPMLAIEILMKIATYAVVAAEIVSIVIETSLLPTPIRWIGAGIAALGVAVFVIAMITMRDSWRAGVPDTDKTELVTNGIFSISRNPAFLGFDLVYIGILLMFFNWVLFAISVFAAVMFHLQIVNVEEDFLLKTFGEEYQSYKKTVNRYLGRRSSRK